MNGVVKYVEDLAGKIGTFVASRRLWFFGIVVALLQLAGFLGLNPETADQLVASLDVLIDAGLAWVVATVVLVKAVGGFVAVAVIAYKLIESYTFRPAQPGDWRGADPKYPVG